MKKYKRAGRWRHPANQQDHKRGEGQRHPRGDSSQSTGATELEVAQTLAKYYRERWTEQALGMVPGDMAREGEWVDYWEKEAQWYEELIGGLTQRREYFPAAGVLARWQLSHRVRRDEAFVDQVLTATCALLKDEVYWLRVNQAAERFRSVVRWALEEACVKPRLGQPGETLRFFKLPPDAHDLPPPPEGGLSEIELARIAELYRTETWWMMTDRLHQAVACQTHFYLECADGWYSAEAYPEVGEEAAIEAVKRRLRGEGDLEVRVIDEGDPEWPVFMVLFCRHKPVEPATQPPGTRFAVLSPVQEEPIAQAGLAGPPSYVVVGWMHPRGEQGATCQTCGENPAQYTYESFGYAGIEADVQRTDEVLKAGEQGVGGSALEGQLTGIFQKTLAAQRQGSYRVVRTASCCEGCLARLSDGFLAMEQAGEFASFEMRTAQGRLSCVLAWRVFTEEGDHRLPALLFTEAQTIEELLPRLRGADR